MTIYYLYYALIIILGFILKDKKRELYILTSFLVLFLIIALRHPSMGIDLHYGYENGYIGVYSVYSNCPWEKVFNLNYVFYEKGFLLFNKVLGIFSKQPQMLLIGTALVSLVPVFFTIYKESEDSLFSILIYLGLPSFLMVFSALRQVIAISLVFLSIVYIRKKKFFTQLILILLAATFHKTALVFLVAYPLYYVKIPLNGRLYSICFLLILYCYSRQIMPYLSRIMPAYVIDNNGSNTLFLVYVLLYGLCSTLDYNGENNGYLNIFYIACCVMCFEHLNSVIARLAMYFEMSLVLLLPSILKNDSGYCLQLPVKILRNQAVYKAFRILTIVCFIFAGLYFIKTTYWSMANPYHFFWETI